MSVKQKIDLSNLNIVEAITNRLERYKATYVIDPEGDAYYLYCGMKLKEKDFERMYPVDIINSNPKGQNVDGTHIK